MKGVGADRGLIRQSTRHLPEMTDTETEDATADGVNNKAWSTFLEGGVKEQADKGEYNCFTILRRGYLRYYVSPFHHVNLCVLYEPFNHICYTISLE